MEHILLYIIALAAAVVIIAAVVTGIVITRKVNTGGKYDYLVVLGTTVNGTRPSIMLSERIRAAYTYLSENPHVVCIATGGKNPDADIPEAQCIAGELIAIGIEPSRIWAEEQASSTRENLRFSLELIEEKTGSRPDHIGLLTSDFHAFRVRMVARQMGISAAVIGAKSAHTVFFYPAFLREILAVWYYCLLNWIQKKV